MTTRGSAQGRAHGRHRRRRSRLRIGAFVALSVLVLAGVGVTTLYTRLNSGITTFDADGVADKRPSKPRKGRNVLVLGSDSRAGGNRRAGAGKDTGGRSDTAVLLHIHGDDLHATAVSIPRDTLVVIPSCKLPDGSWSEPRKNAMFNSAFALGGAAEGNPACAQNTVETLTGLHVDHTVVIDFEGFAELTSVLGGVTVHVPQDLYEGDLDPNLGRRGKRLFKKGEQAVSGQQALDYVRIRHGIGDGSDIGRIERQQDFLTGVLKKVRSDGFTVPKLLPLAETAIHSVTVDPELGTADKLLAFMMSLKDIDAGHTRFITMPWRYQGNRVAVVQPDAGNVWASLKADRSPDEITVDRTPLGGAQ